MEQDWTLSHIALHVNDLDEIAAYYESIGIGIHLPIKPGPPPPPDARQPETLNLHFGKAAAGKAVGSTPADAATFLTFSQIGTLNVECIRNPGADSPFIHHVCFNVPDLYAESAPLITEKGCEVPFVYIRDSLIEENHIDTSREGGVLLSLRPDPDGQRGAREAATRAGLPISGWQFRGIGIVVRDLDKAVAYYEHLGLGTFDAERTFDSDEVADFSTIGDEVPEPVKARTRRATIGPMIYEFTQPLEGKTVYNDALESRGDGVADFIFTVPDLDAELVRLGTRGVNVLESGNPRDGGAYAYCDTRKVGGMMMRLVQA